MPQLFLLDFLQQKVPFFIFLQRSGQQQITMPQGSSFFQDFQEKAKSGRIKPRIRRTAQGARHRIARQVYKIYTNFILL